MKFQVRSVDDHGLKYNCLMFVCPGCLEMYPGSIGLHMLPVNSSEKKPSWEWDGNLEQPTLSPSILTKHRETEICHSYLRNGVFEFLSDCSHPLANQSVPAPDLPEWVEQEV